MGPQVAETGGRKVRSCHLGRSDRSGERRRRTTMAALKSAADADGRPASPEAEGWRAWTGGLRTGSFSVRIRSPQRQGMRSRMLIAAVLVLIAVGSVLFHLLSPWWFTPIASNWQLYRRDDHHHLLDHRRRLHRRRPVHGLLRVPLPPPGGTTGGVTSRRTEAWSAWLAIVTAVGVAAMLAPGLFVWNQFVTVAEGRRRDRGRRPAMAMELPPARQGRPARHRPTRATSAPTTRSA